MSSTKKSSRNRAPPNPFLVPIMLTNVTIVYDPITTHTKMQTKPLTKSLVATPFPNIPRVCQFTHGFPPRGIVVNAPHANDPAIWLPRALSLAASSQPAAFCCKSRFLGKAVWGLRFDAFRLRRETTQASQGSVASFPTSGRGMALVGVILVTFRSRTLRNFKKY